MTKPENGVTYAGSSGFLMWGFSTLEKEERFSYTLNAIPPDYCLEQIEDAMIAREIQKDNEMLID